MYPILGFTKKEVETKIRQKAQQRGMTPDDIRRRLGPVSGTPELYIQAFAEYIDKGISLFTLRFDGLEDAEFFAEEIIRKLKCVRMGRKPLCC